MSRSEVGCHSVIRAVTAGSSTERERVRPRRRGRTASGSTRRRPPPRRPARGDGAGSARQGPRARPARAQRAPRKKLPWTLAQTARRSGRHHSRRGCAARSMTRNSVNANSAIPMSCGRSASAGAETTNAPRASHAARADAGPLATAQLEDGGRDEPDQGGAQEHQTSPPADSVDGSQDDLRAPLLVDPRLPAAVNVHVSTAGIRPAVEDLLARPKVVRQIVAASVAISAASTGSATARNAHRCRRLTRRHPTRARCAPAPPRRS